MSVNPGFGGQSFIPEMLPKIRAVRAMLAKHKSTARLEVDGGINAENIGSIKEAGADTFVAGSAVFHSPNYSATITSMRESLKKAATN